MLSDQNRFGVSHVDKSAEAALRIFGIQDFRGAILNMLSAVVADLAEIAMLGDVRRVCCEKASCRHAGMGAGFRAAEPLCHQPTCPGVAQGRCPSPVTKQPQLHAVLKNPAPSAGAISSPAPRSAGKSAAQRNGIAAPGATSPRRQFIDRHGDPSPSPPASAGYWFMVITIASPPRLSISPVRAACRRMTTPLLFCSHNWPALAVPRAKPARAWA